MLLVSFHHFTVVQHEGGVHSHHEFQVPQQLSDRRPLVSYQVSMSAHAPCSSFCCQVSMPALDPSVICHQVRFSNRFWLLLATGLPPGKHMGSCCLFCSKMLLLNNMSKERTVIMSPKSHKSYLTAVSKCTGSPTRCKGSLTTCTGSPTTCTGFPAECTGFPTTCTGFPAECTGFPTTCTGSLLSAQGLLHSLQYPLLYVPGSL